MNGSILRLEDVVGEKSKSLSITVNKPLDLEYDLGNLLATDPNPLPSGGPISDQIMREIARDNTQLLVNQLWQCETHVVDDTVMCQLPDPASSIPREKPVPKPKTPTKWEAFARTKNIQLKKKSTKVWDEESKSWKFTWGYRKKGTENEVNDYRIDTHVDDHDPKNKQRPTDPRKFLSKNERVAKNNLNRLRNLARARKFKDGLVMPPVSMNQNYIPPKDVSKKALAVATASTASLGRFTPAVRNEKKPKVIPVKSGSNAIKISAADEKSSFLKIFENIQSRKDSIDSNLAVKKVRKDQESEGSGRKKEALSKSKIKKKTQGREHHNKVPIKQKRGGKMKLDDKKGGVKGGKVSKRKGAPVKTGGGGGGKSKKR